MKRVIIIYFSTVFFLISNWAVWQFGVWYDKSLVGLIEAYTLAIPFFRNTIIGDLVYTGSLFAVFEFSRAYFASKKPITLTKVTNNISGLLKIFIALVIKIDG